MTGRTTRQAAEKCGLTQDTLRWYERIGLLDRVARTPGGRLARGPARGGRECAVRPVNRGLRPLRWLNERRAPAARPGTRATVVAGYARARLEELRPLARARAWAGSLAGRMP